ncbi:MAG: hypothetical protein JWP92_620 [Caulobacter sp.]|nr:hypothetical protein [Caulobacter sp.]
MARPFAHAAFALAIAAAPFVVPGSALAANTSTPAEMKAGTYALDKTHASVTAKLLHMGLSNYTFRFTTLDANFTYDPKAPADSKLTVTVAPGSVDTATGADAFGKKFNAELAGEGWLEADKFPTATFTSTAVDIGDGHKGTVTGDLTLHGVTKPVVLDVTFNGSGAGMIPGSYRAGFSASTVIKRSDFGIKKYVPLVGDDVTLNIEVEFARK